VQRERSDQVVAIGLRTPWLRDLYHQLLTLPWWAFLTGFAGLYILLNVLFATLYLLDAGAIANARPGYFPTSFSSAWRRYRPSATDRCRRRRSTET
jgi:hypothetical protein